MKSKILKPSKIFVLNLLNLLKNSTNLIIIDLLK